MSPDLTTRQLQEHFPKLWEVLYDCADSGIGPLVAIVSLQAHRDSDWEPALKEAVAADVVSVEHARRITRGGMSVEEALEIEGDPEEENDG